MSTDHEMATPVTRGELREELGTFEARLEARFDRKLELWGGALEARIGGRIDDLADRVDARFQQIDARFEQIDARFEQIDARFEQIDSRFEQIDSRFAGLSVELARHVETILEAVRGQISVVDEKYLDLPARVAKLETTAAAPKRKRR